MVELLQHRTQEIERRIFAMEQLRGQLRLLTERATGLDPADCDAERVCHVIAPRHDSP